MNTPLLIFAIALINVPLATVASGQKDVDPTLPHRVQEILMVKCAECHGSTVRKPKGAFGFVDILARVKKEYSASTDLADNDLWYYLVDAEEDEFMPPGKAKNGPMTQGELKLIRSWILAGSPLPTTIKPGIEANKPKNGDKGQAGSSSAMTMDDDIPMPKTAGESSFIAPFHPVLVHFPIALIMVAALMEVLRWRQGETWRAPLRLMLGLVLVSALLAGFAGFRAQDAEGYSDGTVAWHQWSAISATGFAIVACALILCKKELTGWRIWLFRLSLLTSAILYGLTGHEGGILVYGPDHFG